MKDLRSHGFLSMYWVFHISLVIFVIMLIPLIIVIIFHVSQVKIRLLILNPYIIIFKIHPFTPFECYPTGPWFFKSSFIFANH